MPSRQVKIETLKRKTKKQKQMQNRRSCTTTMNKMSKKLVYYQSSLTHTNTFAAAAAAAAASLCHCCVAALLPGVAALVDLVSSVNELNAAVEAECECGGERERADGWESRLGVGERERACAFALCDVVVAFLRGER